MNPEFYSTYFVFFYIIILLLIYYFFFYKRYKNLLTYVKYVLVPITFFGGLALYFYGYNIAHHENHFSEKLLMALYSTARLFILGNDIIEIKDVVEHSPRLFQLFSLVMSTAVIIFLSILLHLAGERFRNRLQLWFSCAKEAYIFMGINRQALSLARDLQKKENRLIVFVRDLVKNEDTALYETAVKLGALVLSRESLFNKFLLKNEESMISFHEEIHLGHHDPSYETALLSKLNLAGTVRLKKSNVFFLTENEALNMRVARAVLCEIERLDLKKEAVLHIRTTSDELKDEFDKSLRKNIPNISVRFFDDADVAVRQLVKNYHPVDYISKDTRKAVATSDFKALIIGFGRIGSAALRKLIETGQFVGSDFQAVITDRSLDTIKGRFANRYPGLISNYNLEFVQTEMGHEKFFELVKKHLKDLNYVVVALGNEALNVQVAFDIQQLAQRSLKKDLKIITHVSDSDYFSDLFGTFGSSIDVFGKNEDVFTEDIVIRGSIEHSARRINDYYNSKTEPDKQHPWEELSRIKQLSNISVAEHIRVKLALAGLTTDEVKNFENEASFEGFLGETRTNKLAHSEHLRWNALYFTNGWAKWELSDIPESNRETSNGALRLHACLVDWKEIAKLNKFFGDDFYRYDIENVLKIYILIKNGIYF